jgi:hypothetical protein
MVVKTIVVRKSLSHCGCVGSSPTGGTMDKKVLTTFEGKVVKVTLSDTNTNIENSYRFKSISIMKDILNWIKAASIVSSTERAISKRSMFSMINEWRVHNLLYSFGIKRDRTKSVDLDINQPWYMKLAYTVLSPFYLHFN